MTPESEIVDVRRAPLEDIEKATYEWQMWVDGFGEAGQEKLKGASVMISRVGGLGSVVAYELAAAGIGRLILAHGGSIKPSDLNRQLLMTYAALGKPRIDSVRKRLKELNPRLDIEAVGENVGEDNVAALVSQADVVIDCAPLFEERFAMNDESMRQGKPMIECAMYDLEATITTISPGRSACLRCICPEKPPTWKREFPVFGAVSGTVGCIAAMEAIKVIAGFGQPLFGRMLSINLREGRFRQYSIRRDPDCAACGHL